MTNSLLDRYQEELFALKHTLRKFAESHPHLVKFISGNREEITDPHINQLLEGVAYLNSRVRCQLDDGLSHLSNSLLDILCPHYLAPIPSMSILQLMPHDSIQSGVRIERGRALETQHHVGEACYFQTCYDMTLWPMKINAVSTDASVLDTTNLSESSHLGIRLNTIDPEVKIADLELNTLQLYCHGDRLLIEKLYEFLLEETVSLSVMNPNNQQRIMLDKSALQPMGFERNHTMQPCDSDDFSSYMLLGEFFYFPQKYFFLQISLPDDSEWANDFTAQMWLNFHFNVPVPYDVRTQINSETFKLNCTPIVNLFDKTADIIDLNHKHLEYPISVSSHTNQNVKIHSIKQVIEQDAQGQLYTIPKLYSLEANHSYSNYSWWSNRQIAANELQNKFKHSEFNIAFINNESQYIETQNKKVIVETLCCNGNLPHELGSQDKLPPLRFVHPVAPITQYKLLTPPTAMNSLITHKDNCWKFIAHVTLNQAALSDGTCFEEWLKTLFELYDPGSPYNRALRQAIKSAESENTLGCLPKLMINNFCYGTKFTIEMDTLQNDKTLPYYLFSSVLEKFIVRYNAINTFSQLNVQNQSGVIKSWPLRSATMLLN